MEKYRTCLDSGHGGQIKDKDGDEVDGYDEVIFPVDYKTAGCIVDDVRFMSTVYRPHVIISFAFSR